MAAERAGLALGLGLIVVAALRLPVLEDEAYYWVWSRHLALHYLDHPPVIAWLIRAAQSVLLAPFAALRAVSLACLAITLAAVTQAAARLAPGASGVQGTAAWALLGSPLYAVALLPATPDAPLAAALSLAGYAMVRGLAADRSRGWLVAAGALLGLAGLAKLSAGVVGVGFLLGGLSTAEGRRAAWSAPAVAGLTLAIAPVAAWWCTAPGLPPAVGFQWARITGAADRWLLAGPLTAGAALVMVGPAVTLVATGRGLRAWRTAGDGDDPALRVLLGGAAAILAASGLAVALGRGELNWLMPALVCAVPVAVATAAARPWAGRFRRALQVQAVLTGLILLHIVEPVWPVPAARDRTLRSAGWRDVAREVAAVAEAHGAAVLVTASYQRASLLRYHLRDRWPVREAGGRRRSQYDRWPRPPLAPGQVAVLVGPGPAVGPAFTPLGPPVRAARGRSGRVVERLFIVPARVRATGPTGARTRTSAGARGHALAGVRL